MEEKEENKQTIENRPECQTGCCKKQGGCGGCPGRQGGCCGSQGGSPCANCPFRNQAQDPCANCPNKDICPSANANAGCPGEIHGIPLCIKLSIKINIINIIF